MKKQAILFLCACVLVCGACKGKTEKIKDNEIENNEQVTNVPEMENPFGDAVIGNGVVEDYAALLQEVFPKEKNKFVGYVNGAPIHMTLSCENDVISGSYSYDKYQTEINLSGTVNQTYRDYVELQMTEDTDVSGRFVGIFQSSESIRGLWQDINGTYPMYFYPEGHEMEKADEPTEEIQKLQGNWFGKNDTYYRENSMEVIPLFSDLLYFYMNTRNGKSSGSLTGLAIYDETNKHARTIYWDCVDTKERADEHVAFDFSVNEVNELLLTSNQYGYACGIDSSFDQQYKQSANAIIQPSLVDIGIVSDGKQEDCFHKMINYNDYLFIYNTQGVAYEDSELDGKKVRAGESYIPGCDSMCYYINAGDYLYAAAVNDEGNIEYFTNDTKYQNVIPEPMQEWVNKKNGEVIFHEITGYYPVNDEVEDELLKNIKVLVNGKKVELSAPYSILDSCIGDLDQDGTDDVAVVVSQGDAYYSGSRTVYVFLQKNGSYELMYQNGSAILGTNDGGVFGDPYDGISIYDGTLHLMDYGGSSYRWSHDISFAIKDEKLLLTKIKCTDYSTHTLNGDTTIYDIEHGTIEKRTMAESGDNPSNEQYNNLLIYSGKIANVNPVEFEQLTSWYEKKLTKEPSYPMPTMEELYGGSLSKSVKHSPEEILDKVMKTYYPDMKKVNLPCSNEIIDNYKLLLGYDIPTYYYANETGQLYYYNLEEYNNTIEHSVFYQAFEQSDYNYEFYSYLDETGEQLTY